jgi:hypothetical protein
MKSSPKKAKAAPKKFAKTIARFGRSPDSPPEWLETAKRHDDIMERFESVFIDRVGSTPKARLEWVVKMVNVEPKTPADWENLRWEMAVFCRRVGTDVVGRPDIPTEEEAARVRENFRSIVKKVVEGKTIEVQQVPVMLVWRPNEPAPKSMSEVHQKVWAKIGAEYRGEPPPPRNNDGRWHRVPLHSDWDGDSVNEITELIVQYGNLLRECRAPAPRSDSTCGKWFVASRHKSRVYCSAQCTSRAATHLWRKGGDTNERIGRLGSV